MGKRELRAKYGGTYGEALRRAVRAETDGGDDVLNAMALLHRIARRYPRGAEPHRHAQAALDAMGRLARLLEEGIERKYGCTPGEGPP